MCAEGEGRNDAKGGSCAADGPEEVGVARGGAGQLFSIGEDDGGGEEVVCKTVSLLNMISKMETAVTYQ